MRPGSLFKLYWRRKAIQLASAQLCRRRRPTAPCELTSSPPTQGLRPGCKVLCCRRADHSRLSANDSDDGYEFWTYGSTIDLALEDVRSPSLESITRIAVPLGVLPEDFESVREALHRIVALTGTLNMAALKPAFDAIPMEVNTKEIDASFDFSSSGILGAVRCCLSGNRLSALLLPIRVAAADRKSDPYQHLFGQTISRAFAQAVKGWSPAESISGRPSQWVRLLCAKALPKGCSSR